MKLLVGLGNPGPKYTGTRHNIGFQSIEMLSSLYNIQLSFTDSLANWGRGIVKKEEFFLLKPLTYMNLSGKSVLHFISYFHINYQNLLVIYDDIDLPVGRLRIRKKGGSGGHRGIESIIQHLSTSDFPRLRIGVGRPSCEQDTKDYVLGLFSKREKIIMKQVLDTVLLCIDTMLVEGIEIAMNRFNNLHLE